MPGKPTTKPSDELSPLERRRKVSVAEAARLNSIHEATFRRNYRHLIKDISPRRQAVDLGDALDVGSQKGDA